MRLIWTLLSQNPLGIFDNSLWDPSWPLFSPSSSTRINAESCPVNSPVSCHNSTAFSDSCCFIYPSGQFMSTQFWDAHPAIGPVDSWTIHGLWPDNCDGSYPTYCSAAPQYYNISDIISTVSPSLYEFMNKYWLPNRGSPDRFWMHEWNKHGTCVNTLTSTCYSEGQYVAGIEVVDYFQKAVDLFKQLDTYKALSSAGILPSHDKTYSLKEIQETLTQITGQEAILNCQGAQLNQVWYSFNVKGNLQTGIFVPTYGVHSSTGNCPADGIKYLPKDV